MCQRIGVNARVDKSSTHWTNCPPDFSNSAKSEMINKNGFLCGNWNVSMTRTATLQNQPRGAIGNDAATAARAPKATAFAAKPIDRKPRTVTSSPKAIRHSQKVIVFNSQGDQPHQRSDHLRRRSARLSPQVDRTGGKDDRGRP
jgi:hypothetical protein